MVHLTTRFSSNKGLVASTVTSTIVAVVMMMMVVTVVTVVVVTITTAATTSSTTSVGAFKSAGFFLGGHYKKVIDLIWNRLLGGFQNRHNKYQRTSRENTSDTHESDDEEGLHFLQRKFIIRCCMLNVLRLYC